MANIITFITIIVIFLLFFLIFDQGIKKSIKPVLILVILGIGVWYYYYMPFHLKFLDEEELFSQIELEYVPSWNANNKLTADENSKILNLIKGLEVRRLSRGTSSYLTQDRLIIYLRDRKRYMNVYTIVINPDQQTGKILKSGSDKSYIFEIKQEKIDVIQKIFDEYYQLAFDKIPNDHLSYELNKEEIHEDYTTYELNLENEGNRIRLNDAYVAYKYGTGRRYSHVISDTNTDDQIKFEFKVLNENTRTYEYIKLVLSGEAIVDGGYEKFQKVIDFK
jgi:hypothetical protein